MRLRPALSVLLLAAAVAACGDGGGGQAEPQPTVTVTVTETASPTAAPTSPGSADPGPDPCAELGIGEQVPLPVLFVTAPAIGAQVPSGFEVTGCTNAFEAAFQWELLTGEGEVLASGAEMASCGTGCLGEFSFTVDYDVTEERIGTLRVFTTSAEDGAEQDLNVLPLRLQP